MGDVEKNYQEFWKDIVENEDGSLNLEQVKKELCDYSMIMDNCTSAYSEMTCGNVSKPNTHFCVVREIFFENFWHKSFVQDDVKTILDNIDDIEDLKKELKDYFELEG